MGIVIILPIALEDPVCANLDTPVMATTALTWMSVVGLMGRKIRGIIMSAKRMNVAKIPWAHSSALIVAMQVNVYQICSINAKPTATTFMKIKDAWRNVVKCQAVPRSAFTK